MTTDAARSGTRAIVFDFDGTIVDTETPVYESWRDTFLHAGAEPVSFDIWLAQIGQSDGSSLDVRADLCSQIGVAELPQELEDFRRRRRNEMLDALPVREGVLDWIAQAKHRGFGLAIASSSPSAWVLPHLAERELDRYFSAVVCADPPTPGKPDPAVYLGACRALGVDPAAAVAIEDSPHGVTAAKTAGLRCVAVPGPITATADFSHADAVSASLATVHFDDWR